MTTIDRETIEARKAPSYIHVRPTPAEACYSLIMERFPHAANECSECRHVKRTWAAFVRAMEE